MFCFCSNVVGRTGSPCTFNALALSGALYQALHPAIMGTFRPAALASKLQRFCEFPIILHHCTQPPLVGWMLRLIFIGTDLGERLMTKDMTTTITAYNLEAEEALAYVSGQVTDSHDTRVPAANDNQQLSFDFDERVKGVAAQ